MLPIVARVTPAIFARSARVERTVVAERLDHARAVDVPDVARGEQLSVEARVVSPHRNPHVNDDRNA